MTHDDMIEAAARAWYERDTEGSPWSEASEDDREDYLGNARAALVAAGVVPAGKHGPFPDGQVRLSPDGFAWQRQDGIWWSTENDQWFWMDDNIADWPVLTATPVDVHGLANAVVTSADSNVNLSWDMLDLSWRNGGYSQLVDSIRAYLDRAR